MPGGGHRDEQPAPVEAGRERVGAAVGVVGGVDPHPGRLAVVEHRLVDGRVVGAGDRQAVAGHLAALVRPLLPGDVEGPDVARAPSVATTCTTAPAASRPRAFSAATAPPPTTSTRRPATSRLTGYGGPSTGIG